jgi:hypothetical protein
MVMAAKTRDEAERRRDDMDRLFRDVNKKIGARVRRLFTL